MPQLDKFSFMPQIFWLVLVFFLLYFILLNLILPQLYSTIKTRTLLLSNLKNDLLNFGDKEIELYQKYNENVNYFVTQTNYSFTHLRYVFDTHFSAFQNFIKNNVNF